MKMREIITHNGKEYVFAKQAELDGKVFYEFAITDVMNPDVIYLDEKKEILNDAKTYLRLREKYCIDKDLLYGKIVLDFATQTPEERKQRLTEQFLEDVQLIPDYKNKNVLKSIATEKGKQKTVFSIDNKRVFSIYTDSAGNPVMESTPDFVSKGQVEIDKSFNTDLENFSTRGEKALAGVLAKRGISDSKKWLKEQIYRGDQGYTYAPEKCISQRVSGQYNAANQTIILQNLGAVFTRAHEVAHKISYGGEQNDVTRVGLLHVNGKLVVDNATGHQTMIHEEMGRAINEGATDFFAEMLSGIPCETARTRHIEQMKQEEPNFEPIFTVTKRLARLVGNDDFLEAYLFDPNILKNRINQIAGDKDTYDTLVKLLDEQLKIAKELGKSNDPNLKKNRTELNEEVKRILADLEAKNKQQKVQPPEAETQQPQTNQHKVPPHTWQNEQAPPFVPPYQQFGSPFPYNPIQATPNPNASYMSGQGVMPQVFGNGFGFMQGGMMMGMMPFMAIPVMVMPVILMPMPVLMPFAVGGVSPSFIMGQQVLAQQFCAQNQWANIFGGLNTSANMFGNLSAGANNINPQTFPQQYR